ncbi:MAG: (d)CMP kinase [Anaerovoracaceae bacterium]|jgi:cytidylate kinase
MIRIAIDGPGGAGKSTIARRVAAALQINYIDTGAMYRAVGYQAVRKGVDPGDEAAMEKMMADTDIDFRNGSIYLDGHVVDREIRTPEISAMASRVSALAPVRRRLVALQREMGRKGSAIMDGRDIGNNVLHDAEYKFYLTASPEERARRRCKELREKGQQVSCDEVLRDINRRDHNDMTRALDPLVKADDAIEVDTTGMSIEEVVDTILKEVNNGSRQTV